MRHAEDGTERGDEGFGIRVGIGPALLIKACLNGSRKPWETWRICSMTSTPFVFGSREKVKPTPNTYQPISEARPAVSSSAARAEA